VTVSARSCAILLKRLLDPAEITIGHRLHAADYLIHGVGVVGIDQHAAIADSPPAGCQRLTAPIRRRFSPNIVRFPGRPKLVVPLNLAGLRCVSRIVPFLQQLPDHRKTTLCPAAVVRFCRLSNQNDENPYGHRFVGHSPGPFRWERIACPAFYAYDFDANDPIAVVLNEERVPLRDRTPTIPEAMAAVLDRALQPDPANASPQERRTTTQTLLRTRLGREVQPTRLTTRQREILGRLGFDTPAQILSSQLPRAP
jgi:hypothetical protein